MEKQLLDIFPLSSNPRRLLWISRRCLAEHGVFLEFSVDDYVNTSMIHLFLDALSPSASTATIYLELRVSPELFTFISVSEEVILLGITFARSRLSCC